MKYSQIYQVIKAALEIQSHYVINFNSIDFGFCTKTKTKIITSYYPWIEENIFTGIKTTLTWIAIDTIQVKICGI